MLNIENITYSYGRNRKPVLSNYSLTVAPGTICGLLGQNGAGKSTLIYLITGLLFPQNGSVTFNGHTPSKREVAFLNDVFIVPEEFQLPDMTLADFVKINAPFYPKFSLEDFHSHLETFELSPNQHLAKLSMGQKKRVFISFALASNTSLLLLDEPTNGLDIPGKRLFRKALLNGMNDDRTVIISTHQVYDVERILDHVVITDTDGVKLDASVSGISSRLKFLFTPDRQRASEALMALDAPGGYNIVEKVCSEDEETDINLETLFEFVRSKPSLAASILNN